MAIKRLLFTYDEDARDDASDAGQIVIENFTTGELSSLLAMLWTSLPREMRVESVDYLKQAMLIRTDPPPIEQMLAQMITHWRNRKGGNTNGNGQPPRPSGPDGATKAA